MSISESNNIRNRRNAFAIAVIAGALLFAIPLVADEGLAGFSRLHPKPAGEAAAEDQWGPVPTDKLSVVNLAPVLLAYFNNAPVFGIPGTVSGDLQHRTQLTGDWGGERTKLALRGIFIDLYSTSVYQDITSGGLKEGSAFVQNTQLSLNIDTGRAGLWPGGLLHFTVQGRHGAAPEETFTAGATVPHYTGLVFPAPTRSSDVLPTEYFLVQPLSKQFAVVVGRISNIFIPDQTLMADSYKYYFSNFNFNKNPMTPNFYNPTSLVALGVWAPSKKFAIAGGVLDPYSEPNNLAHDAFKKVNLYLMSVSSYSVAGLPGQFSPAFNWSNKPKVNLDSPFGTLAPAQIPQAVGALVGSPDTHGLPINYKDDSWFAIANVSQYFYVKDAPASIPGKMKSGQVLNGIGVFARAGFAPEETNTVSRDASVAVFAHGLADARPYDSFGAGFYYNAVSGSTKDSISRLTRGREHATDEKGAEVFYNFAITPAVRFIASYQHIWDPLAASLAVKQDKTDVVMTRLTVAF